MGPCSTALPSSLGSWPTPTGEVGGGSPSPLGPRLSQALLCSLLSTVLQPRCRQACSVPAQRLGLELGGGGWGPSGQRCQSAWSLSRLPFGEPKTSQEKRASSAGGRRCGGGAGSALLRALSGTIALGLPLSGLRGCLGNSWGQFPPIRGRGWVGGGRPARTGAPSPCTQSYIRRRDVRGVVWASLSLQWARGGCKDAEAGLHQAWVLGKLLGHPDLGRPGHSCR